jgi:hypothetical protein
MLLSSFAVLASFTVPYEIGNGPASLLWILPMIAAISIVYKALKLPVITADRLIREVVVLFFTILLFMVLIAVGLYIIGQLVTG